jgi:polyhydroxyalkanoate synthesis repressor PhaR
MAAEHVIKKYANRRLYDAASSRHVTLEDLRKLIVQGERIKVVDDKSGEDLTRQVLLQIIAEQEQFGRPILTVPVLESVIRFYGNALQELMTRYLEQSVRAFVEQQAAAQEQLARLMASAPLNPMTELARQNLELWKKMQESMLAAMTGASASGKPRKPDESS